MEKKDGRVYGYARVSTREQNLGRQEDAIKTYCKSIGHEIKEEDIFRDKKTGKNFEREEYSMLKRVIRKGDTVIIQDTDRLGRNKKMVKTELTFFKEKGVILRILNIPTTLIDLKKNDWVMEMISAILIEVYTSMDEQDNIKRSERTLEGLEKARKNGKIFGRRRVRVDPDRFEELYKEWKVEKRFSGVEVQRLLGLSSATFYRRVYDYEVKKGIRKEGESKVNYKQKKDDDNGGTD